MSEWQFKRTRHKNIEIYKAFKNGKCHMGITLEKTEKGYRKVSISGYSRMQIGKYYETAEECAENALLCSNKFIENHVIILNPPIQINKGEWK